MKTLVIGLGNPILTDDGVGIYTARAVRYALPAAAQVDVVELCVGGLALMEAMAGYERAIIVDALWTPDESQLGEVVCFTAGDLPPTMNTASAHDVDLPTALQVGRQMGAVLPQDQHIQIVAVRARDVLDFGEQPSAPVQAAIPEAAACVLSLLGWEYLPGPDSPALTELILNGGYDDFS